MKIETMFKREGPRIKAFLERIAEEVGADKDSVYEKCDDYGYSLLIGDHEDGINVGYELADSWAYEGEGKPRGCNPMLDIIGVGGEIHGTIAPYNYTPDVWVLLNEPGAQQEIEARMDDIEDAYDNILETIREARK